MVVKYCWLTGRMPAATNFQPQEAEMRQVLGLLQQSQSHDNATQAEVHKKLEQFNRVPTFNCYLVYVLSRMTNQGILQNILCLNCLSLHVFLGGKLVDICLLLAQ